MASGNADSGGKLEINVQLTRCVCIHALHQAVDTIIQALLYQRNIVPRLVSDLIDVTAEQLLNLKISEADEDYCLNSPLPVSLNAAQKFSQEFLMMRNNLKTTFRSHNGHKMREVAIVIGPASYSPVEIYRIPISLRSCISSGVDHCGQACSELSDKELRRVSAAVFTRRDERSTLTLGPSSRRVSVLLNAERNNCFGEHLEENNSSDAFSIPDCSLAKKRKINVTEIALCHGNECYEQGKAAETLENDSEGLTWYFVTQNMKGFSE